MSQQATNSNEDYAYIIYEFDKRTEMLVRNIRLQACDPVSVKEQFITDLSQPPYISDSHQILSYKQALILDPNLKAANLNFDKFDYFIESNQKNTD